MRRGRVAVSVFIDILSSSMMLNKFASLWRDHIYLINLRKNPNVVGTSCLHEIGCQISYFRRSHRILQTVSTNGKGCYIIYLQRDFAPVKH